MLIGHQNPLAIYPAPVIPVVEVSGERYVVHCGKSGNVIAPLAEDEPFTSHAFHILSDIAYDYQTEGLFAYSPTNLAVYKRRNEAGFFSQVLSDTTVSADNPFARYSLAFVTKSPHAVSRELSHCLVWLLCQENLETASGGPGFAERWYRQQLAELRSEAESGAEWLAKLQLPDTWPDLLRSTCLATGFVQAGESPASPGGPGAPQTFEDVGTSGIGDEAATIAGTSVDDGARRAIEHLLSLLDVGYPGSMLRRQPAMVRVSKDKLQTLGARSVQMLHQMEVLRGAQAPANDALADLLKGLEVLERKPRRAQ